MFHKQFYPTPVAVLDLLNLDCKNKIVLEPQAGKGDIIDYLHMHGAKQVLAYEINQDLQKIVSSKCRLLGGDFFDCTAEDISHVNMIVMNPPFENADKHIIHAWKIAPEGCEIVSLCNNETIAKDYRYEQLSRLISDYGDSENLGDVFSTAERKTNIDVAVVRLFKPVTSSTFDFDGFFIDEDDEQQNTEGIMPYNAVRAIVNQYVATMKSFDRMKEHLDMINALTKPIGLGSIQLQVNYNESALTKEDFNKIIQKRSWNVLFDKMNMRKYVTSGVMKDINSFVEKQTKYPFTMKNIYRMFQVIYGTRADRFNQALEEAIDAFTKHTHENRFGVEGWKTNCGYMLNKKFIVDWMVEPKYSDHSLVTLRSSNNEEKISDLTKVLCNITGTNFNEIPHLRDYFIFHKGLKTNQWYTWGFFEIKCFKKGTVHIKFKDLEHWYLLNRAYGYLKGFSLPETHKK